MNLITLSVVQWILVVYLVTLVALRVVVILKNVRNVVIIIGFQLRLLVQLQIGGLIQKLVCIFTLILLLIIVSLVIGVMLNIISIVVRMGHHGVILHTVRIVEVGIMSLVVQDAFLQLVIIALINIVIKIMNGFRKVIVLKTILVCLEIRFALS